MFKQLGVFSGSNTKAIQDFTERIIERMTKPYSLLLRYFDI